MIKMSINQKVDKVVKLYESLEEEMKTFQQGTGLKCAVGCGKCCFKADIDATVLEFLPLAYNLYQQGLAESWYEKLKAMPADQFCILLQQTNHNGRSGRCSSYTNRGLICRLFGFSAVFDKYGNRRLSTCHIIKTETPESYKRAESWVQQGKEVPIMRNYHYQLNNIDPRLSQSFYPINKAIRLALEEVMAYYAYRDISAE